MSLLNESSTLNPFTPPDSAGVRRSHGAPGLAPGGAPTPHASKNRVTVRDVENKLVRA